ncbi:MAG: ABC transporter substrate-binding protein [Defluviitaleaceae bacterium]|nr:ABC transporter substrate-binding protein [Defluviitaleaceae bacterium]
MKKLLILAMMALFTTALFTACGAGDTDMVFGWWGNPTRNEQTTAVLNLFMEEHDGVFVEELQAGWGDYWPMLRTLAPAGDLPDVIQMDWSTLLEFRENDLLVDLLPMFNDGRISTANIPQTVVEGGRMGAGIYAIPIGMNATAMVYNATLLVQLGLSAPRNITLQQFIDLSREIYELSGVRTNWAFNDPANQMEIHLRAQGVVMLEANGMGGTPANYEEFFQTIALGIEEGWHIRPEDMAGRDGTAQDPLVYPPNMDNPNLRTWNSPVWSNMIVALSDAAPDGTMLAMTTYPSTNPTVSNFGRASMFLSITTQSENVDDAAALIDFWLNDIRPHQIMMAERGVIPNTEIANIIYPALPVLNQVQSEFVSWMGDNSTPVNPPRPEGSAEIIDELVRITELVALGQLTPQQAATDFFNFGNSRLN